MIKNKNYKEIKLNDDLMSKKGIYKFYVRKDELDKIINTLKLTDLDIDKDIEKYEDFYCIYVGQTQSDSNGFKSRVYYSHILGRKNSKGNESTLRISLKAVLNYDDNELNTLLDNENFNSIFILFDELDDVIDQKELEEINNEKFKILNIDDNKHYLKNKDNIKALLRLKRLRKDIKSN